MLLVERSENFNDFNVHKFTGYIKTKQSKPVQYSFLHRKSDEETSSRLVLSDWC